MRLGKDRTEKGGFAEDWLRSDKVRPGSVGSRLEIGQLQCLKGQQIEICLPIKACPSPVSGHVICRSHRKKGPPSGSDCAVYSLSLSLSLCLCLSFLFIFSRQQWRPPGVLLGARYCASFFILQPPSSSILRLHLVLLGLTYFYWVLLGFTEFCRLLVILTRFIFDFIGFYWLLLGFT